MRSITAASLLTMVWLTALAAPVYAHSGGLNSYGCHNDNINGGYHCHRSGGMSSAPQTSRPPSSATVPTQTWSKPRREVIVGRASVIDGDTIEIQGQRIRFWGIDAPESAQPCVAKGKSWRCGQKAALALSDHLGQKTVACEHRDRDRYGRIVAKCSIAAQDIGAWLVKSGWALDYREYSGGGYSRHESQAAHFKSGIWRGTFDKPWDWRKQ